MTTKSPFKALLATWPQFSLTADRQPLSAAHQAYLKFYQLDDCTAQAETYRFGALAVDNRRIALQYWQAVEAKGLVYGVHGYWEHSGLLEPLIEFCLAEGYSVVTFDEPGHGLSGGEPVAIDDFAEYTRVLQAVVAFTQPLARGKPLVAIGHSNGGAVLLDYLFSGCQPVLDKAIVLSPLIRITAWHWINTALKFVPPQWQKLPRFIGHAGSHNAAFARLLQRDPLQTRYVSRRWLLASQRWLQRFLVFSPSHSALVLIQGDRDQTVDWPFNVAALKQRLANLTVHIIPGAYHNLMHESDGYRQPVWAIVRRTLAEQNPE